MSNMGINELDQGIWTDPNTGLIWARISIGQEWINGQCMGIAKKIRWEKAELACQNLNLAGFNDWRLPTIDELETLIIQGKTGYNCPKNILFKPQQRWGWYWSSSPDEGYDPLAYGVCFSSGAINLSGKIQNHFIRAVRSDNKIDKA